MSWRACLRCVATALACLLGLPLSAHAEWTPPVRLSNTGDDVHVSEDGRGDALAVWRECRSDCKEQVVMADYFPAGASWQAPVQISAGEGYAAEIAGDLSGDGIALWDSHGGLQSAVRLASVGVWQASTPVGAGAGNPSELKLAVDAAGDAVAVWENDHVVEAAFRLAATGVWGAPVAISAPNEETAEPQVAIRDSGEAAAAWNVYEPETVPCPNPPSNVPCQLIVKSKSSIKSAFRLPNSTWEAPVTLTSADNTGEPQIALDGSGNATALWRVSNGADRLVESSLRPAGGHWLTPVAISRTPLPYVGNELDSNLQLAVDSQGEATAAWMHEYANATHGLSGANAVETTVRKSDGSWQAPSVISGPELHVDGLRLAENASGTAVAVWDCSGGPHGRVGFAYPLTVRGAIRMTAQERWRPPADISAPEGGFADVALNPDGRAVAIWEELGPYTASAPPAGIYTSFYEAGLGTPGMPQAHRCASSAPALSDLHMTHRRFRVALSAKAIGVKNALGTAFLFHLSTTARVRVSFKRLATGVERNHHCVAATRALRRQHAKRCHRTVAMGMLERRSELAGKDRIPFNGRIDRRPLRPGNYHALVIAANAYGSSVPAVIHFRIIR